MFKLVVTDLDGTFLNSGGSFDGDLFDDVYEEMKKKGVAFAACTGKQCERVEELFAGREGIWILGDSAARIKRDGRTVRTFSLERELALASIREILDFDPNLVVIACTGASAYVREDIGEADYAIVKNSYREVSRTSSFEQIEEPFVKITVYDPAGRSAAVRLHVERTMHGQIYIVDSEADWLDITASGTHKGETVMKLQEMLGVAKEETLSFGDGENDVELMDIAEFSFAVRNACENTKAAAAFVTRSNDENGVLLTVRKMLALLDRVPV
ncbi:HAD-IIB family hydrolase [Saccharibacillus sp. CPCC 101409]|uniref:HAD-IIB family hydrolase n=1 Tax=Saccharibacillus sp. CPCC 101409 TaxID=3058041 RepID=UPI002673EDEE|nr:HAD-IIB family hydrolase [Saccharibacillus sp. CPCC 101409]MDO3413264.1 HAD-IIB family hydrolase [Saccharibacillus sp. CPCC 101409]